MSTRLAAGLAALLAAALAALGGAAPAAAVSSSGGRGGGGTVSLLSPDDASALANVAGSEGVSAPAAVDGLAALAASTLPGAATYLEAGLSLDEAVGTAPLTALVAGRAFARTMCWAVAAWHQWGTWPYQQRLIDTTYWCAKYGSRITFRTTSVTAGGTLCGLGWRSAQLIAGGTGFPSFVMRSSGGFSCPTAIPWFTLHPSRHLDVRHDDRGVSAIVGSG